MALAHSDHFLNLFSKHLDLSNLEQKYKLVKLCQEEIPVATTKDFLDQEEVERDSFYLGRHG